MTHRYRLFGLALDSELPLPELAARDDDTAADVIVTVGAVPAPPADAGQAPSLGEGGAVIAVEGIARYAVSDGRRIVVDAADGAEGRDVRLYLLGSAMGLLLHQRGLLPLHANAVEVDGAAAAFMGASGEGKSTLAAWFHDHGLRVLADDVCVVCFDEEGRAMATPGLARLRLWRDALDRSGRSAADHPLSFSGEGKRQKYDVALERVSDSRRPVPLTALYLLARGDDFAVERLTGLDAAEAVFANTYRGAYVGVTDGHRAHWQSCVDLVRLVPIHRVTRRWGFDGFDEQGRRLIEHLRGL